MMTSPFTNHGGTKIKKSFTKTLQLSYLFIIAVMIIPAIYSTVVTQIHTSQYDNIITNVGTANRINQIAKVDIPNELWEIVNGKKDFYTGKPYAKLQTIFDGISEMQKNTKSKNNKQKLDVALRACTTLQHNIQLLENQIDKGFPVTQNEAQLEEIRTITALFSDIMQDFILAETESAGRTNTSIKKSSLILSFLQVVIILFSLAISINGYFIVSRSIKKPLSEMQDFSNQISQGNFNSRVEVPEVTELSPLANNMNSMAQQIDILLKKNIEEQKNFQKAEVKALQAQITPHFLYNTFDTIIWLAEQEQTEEVVKITKAFSNFLRISLSRGHEWITVEQELDHIRNYLTIQKIRYNDILNYEINVNEELSDLKMIKLTLQPLVENAIYHGIKNKRGRGHLKVNVDYLDDSKNSIRFSVSDDGAGFTQERLEEVKQELESGSADAEKLSSVYGMYNVNKKLKLYYGDKTEGLQIESEYRKGSTIWFIIPVVFAEENNV